MKVATPGPLVTAEGARASRSWVSWVSSVSALLTALASSGTTAQRPTTFLYVGRPYFDSDLGYAIWYDGTGWVDATGGSV